LLNEIQHSVIENNLKIFAENQKSNIRRFFRKKFTDF